MSELVKAGPSRVFSTSGGRNFLASSPFLQAFSAIDASRGGAPSTLWTPSTMGPPAKMAIKPYLKCSETSLPTLPTHRIFLQHYCSAAKLEPVCNSQLPTHLQGTNYIGHYGQRFFVFFFWFLWANFFLRIENEVILESFKGQK
jgi:hypothetical protein